MKRLKKNSIGFNTISSTNGLVSARGVKSKPKNLEIFGYTHEIGEGEKSPDNPYKLRSLDIGNMNLCRDWNFSSDLFTVYGNKLTLTVTENTTRYQISSKKAFTYKKDKIYLFLKYQGTFTDGASAPIFRIRFLNSNGYNVTEKQITYSNFNKCVVLDLSNIDVTKIMYYNLTMEGLTNDGNADYDFTLDIVLSEYYISSYFEDKHSIVISNNDTAIQVPVPVALNSVNSFSDYIYKDTDNLWKLVQNTATIDSYNNEYISTPYISSTGELSAGATVIYQLETPVMHVLSDYSQDLLNSFELQNNNEISVEGLPEIKISGYIQK